MSRKVGLWLIGAYGGVSTTIAVGLVALKKQLVDQCGVVSSLPQFQHLDLLNWDQIAVGGHEIRQSSYTTEAQQLCQGTNPVISPAIVEQCTSELAALDAAICPGILCQSGAAIENLSSPEHSVAVEFAADALAKIEQDLLDFKNRESCDSVVVINLASTEPPTSHDGIPASWSELSKLIERNECSLPSSCLYAIGALRLNMPFINFTPSVGNDLLAIRDLAEQNGVCHMGHDGKTGETFLKSVLAPAFANRNLEIMSWVGHNIFGNMDGQILDDPKNKATKVSSKGRMLEHLLGYQPQSHISIEYIQSLGDWKTAWDHIHFKGFLGTPMTMQFTWQGCDSILAAPLVLDLFRFAELADRAGETGIMTYLSSFFKSPMGTTEHDFSIQSKWLVNWAREMEIPPAAK